MHRLLEKIAPKDGLKILVIKYGPLGEVILTSPLIRTVKENFPQSRLFLLCDPPSYTIYSHNPYVDEIIFWDGHRFKGRGIKGKLAYLTYLRSLKALGFDLVIDAYGGTRSATWSLASGAPIRVGYKKRGLGPFYNIKVEHNFSQYHCECVLDLARAMGLRITSRLPRIYTSREDEDRCESFIEENGFKKDGGFLVGINPAGSHRFKRWSEERFAELGDRIIERYGAGVVLLWGPGEREVAESVKKKMKEEAFVACRTNFRQLAAFIKRFDLFITNDSSPLHVSAAVRTTPTVAIFTAVDYSMYIPRGKHYRAVQRKVDCDKICFVAGSECDRENRGEKRCLDLIEVGEVFQAVEELVEKYCHVA